ncbi:MAG: NADH-quinone oxidoreductase subunit C [Chloroflexota bacterium]
MAVEYKSAEDVSFLSSLQERFPELVVTHPERGMPIVSVPAPFLLEVARFLHDDPSCGFKFLDNVTSVDRLDHFEVVYHLFSMSHGYSVALKSTVSRETPTISSVTSVWRGADLQEREVYDLMGIEFAGHPDLKRVLLWEGFEGHPLRKDFRQQSPEVLAHSLLRRKDETR